MASKDKPGFYKGKHYTKYVDEVKSLMRDNRLDDAERLLLELVNATEAEARSEGLVTGIGANIFKLGGAVITFGIVASFIVGGLRYVITYFW